MVKLPKSSKHDVLSTTCSNKMMNFILQPFFSRRRVLRATPPLDLLLRYDSSTPTSSNANPPFPPCHQYTHAHAHARTFVHFPRTRTLSLSHTHTHSLYRYCLIFGVGDWTLHLSIITVPHLRIAVLNTYKKNPSLLPPFSFCFYSECSDRKTRQDSVWLFHKYILKNHAFDFERKLLNLKSQHSFRPCRLSGHPLLCQPMYWRNNIFK